MPLLQDLELSSGALFGLGRVGIGLEQKSGENIRWNNTSVSYTHLRAHET